MDLSTTEIAHRLALFLERLSNSQTKREQIINLYNLIRLFITKNGFIYLCSEKLYRFRKNFLAKIKIFLTDVEILNTYELNTSMITLHNLIIEHDKLYN